MTKFNLGPNVLKAYEMELFSSRQEPCLRKAANVKEENFIAFQDKKRILYYIIQITSVLPLMIRIKNELNKDKNFMIIKYKHNPTFNI